MNDYIFTEIFYTQHLGQIKNKMLLDFQLKLFVMNH